MGLEEYFHHKNHKFLLQGSILAIAGLICRVIGLLYRIPMIKIIGTTGNGYYTSAYSIYSLFLIISSYSFPTAISKVISTKFAQKRFVDVKKIISCAFTLAFIVGIIMFIIMYFGADAIAISLQKPHLVIVLQCLAPTLFIMAFLSVFRGIFQGMGNMVPTAISQIFEQIFNAITSVVFSYLLFSRGEIANIIYNETDYNYAYGAAGGAIGTGIGAFVALVILIFMFISFNSRYRQVLKYNNQFSPISTSNIYNNLFLTIIPIILSSTIYNISSVLDDTIFSNVMTLMKQKEDIISLMGVYGEYHILFNIPVAVSNSLTSSIIPSISKAVSQNNGKEVVEKIKYSIKYTLLIVLPSFVGLVILAEPICKLLFDGENVDILINVLRIGAIAVVFFSLSTVTSGILQGLSKFKKPVENAFIALIIHIIVLVLLMVFFKLNIYAVIIANIVFSFIINLLNNISINRIVRYKKHLFNNVIMPTIISICMGVVGFLMYLFLNNTFLSGDDSIKLIIKLIICIFVCVIFYLVFIIFFGVVRKRDCAYIPFMSKFARYMYD